MARARTSSTKRQVSQAARRYEAFSGHEAGHVERWNMPPIPKAAILVGTVDYLGYTTRREGKVQRFIHKFNARSRPLFLVSHDGRQLLLYGGAFQFGARGIEDKQR